MKKIQKLIGPEDVFLDVEALDGQSAMSAVADCLSASDALDQDLLLAALEEREKLGSTSVGDGFAIPHAKIRGLEKIIVILLRFQAPVLFNGKDLVKMVAAVVSPPDQPAAHLQVLSQIARLLKHEDFRQRLLEARSPEETVEIVAETATREGL